MVLTYLHFRILKISHWIYLNYVMLDENHLLVSGPGGTEESHHQGKTVLWWQCLGFFDWRISKLMGYCWCIWALFHGVSTSISWDIYIYHIIYISYYIYIILYIYHIIYIICIHIAPTSMFLDPHPWVEPPKSLEAYGHKMQCQIVGS